MGKVYCSKCVYGRQDVDKMDNKKAVLAMLLRDTNPVFICELDGKAHFGAEGCEKGKSRPFTWKDWIR